MFGAEPSETQWFLCFHQSVKVPREMRELDPFCTMPLVDSPALQHHSSDNQSSGEGYGDEGLEAKRLQKAEPKFSLQRHIQLAGGQLFRQPDHSAASAPDEPNPSTLDDLQCSIFCALATKEISNTSMGPNSLFF